MADKEHYNKTIKVPESVIKEIRELGMSSAIKKAKSGKASSEFVEGVRRFYPKAIEGIDSKTSKRETSGAGVKTNKTSSSNNSTRSSAESAKRRLARKATAGAGISTPRPAPAPVERQDLSPGHRTEGLVNLPTGRLGLPSRPEPREDLFEGHRTEGLDLAALLQQLFAARPDARQDLNPGHRTQGLF